LIVLWLPVLARTVEAAEQRRAAEREGAAQEGGDHEPGGVQQTRASSHEPRYSPALFSARYGALSPR
jgi:hypothetical protein